MTGSHISLFSGVGMTDRAIEKAGFKTVVTAEIDPFCREVLKTRFPDAQHLDDVKYVTPRMVGPVTRPLIVSGGFPCQGVSSAGTGLGLQDVRSGLWSEFGRVIEQFQPDYVLIENSPMLRSRGLERILADLGDLNYNCRWDCIPAASVGAPHMRDRIFIVAWRAEVNAPVVTRKEDILGVACSKGVLGVRHDGTEDYLTKFPRAGQMIDAVVYKAVAQAPIREAKKAILAHAVPCPATPTLAWPTPAASNPQDGESPVTWLARRETLKEKGINGNGAGMPLSIAVRLYPTPTKSDGSGGPGTSPKRTGGKNLRTTVNDLEGNGRLSPRWVEWMMGLPSDWTNPDVPNGQLPKFGGWGEEPAPRTVEDGLKNRSKRIRALGNGLVWQAASVALDMIPTR